MHPSPREIMCSRRDWLTRAGCGIGMLALARLLADEERLLVAGDDATLGIVRPRSDASAKSVIMLFMGGGPSQVDTFDPKPLLAKLHGQDVPESIAKDVPRIARSPLDNLLASPFKFRQHGQSGLWISELFPHLAKMADDLCVIRGMRHPSPIHAPAEYLSLTGTQVGDRPSLGAWLTYGLGSENRDLPAFVVMLCESEAASRSVGWNSGFLPAQFQGTQIDPVQGIAHLQLPEGQSTAARRSQLDLLHTLNRHHQSQLASHSELEARIRSYELAFRMQAVAPEACDLSLETAATHQLYGLDQERTKQFGSQCLLARRLVERGVRFVQLRLGKWDAHSKLESNHRERCGISDQPIAALLADLKQRGLLDQTLVIWGGEFGRTPTAQPGAGEPGRDHSPSGYTMWLAGGGVQGGQVIGRTDDVGYAAIERPVHPNDLHATVLTALGIDQHELFYLHNNRRELVTVNGGKVIHEALQRA